MERHFATTELDTFTARLKSTCAAHATAGPTRHLHFYADVEKTGKVRINLPVVAQFADSGRDVMRKLARRLLQAVRANPNAKAVRDLSLPKLPTKVVVTRISDLPTGSAQVIKID